MPAPRTRTVPKSEPMQLATTVTKKPSGVVVDGRTANKAAMVDDLPASPAYVNVTQKFTQNIGNYSSVGASVSVTIPCHTSDAAIDAAKARASKLCARYLDEEYKDACGDAPKG